MKYKYRKTLQRQMNKLYKEINRNIANDDLWRGRFIIKQTNADYYNFQDGSGGILYSIARAYDKKTGKTKVTVIECCGNDWYPQAAIWRFMNDFIIEDCDVWAEPDIRTNKIDYTKIGVEF